MYSISSKFKVVVVVDRELSLYCVVPTNTTEPASSTGVCSSPDKEVEHKDDVGGGKDPPGIRVNLLDTLERVPLQ